MNNETPIVVGADTYSYTYTGLRNGTEYTFRVTAVNSVGSSNASTAVKAIPASLTGGNSTGGNSTGGNNTGGNSTGGNNTGGNSTGGNSTDDNSPSDNNTDKPDTPTAPSANFSDIPQTAFYSNAVVWAVEKGITNGTSETTFSPDNSCTRAQIVTFLWRAAGSPKANTDSPFADVPADSYYYDAVLWAVEQGITSGTGAATFSPDATCTRAQAVTFLYRYEKSPAVSGTNDFADVSAGTYYADAVQWAVDKNVTTGTGAAAFSPDATCTRGQIVTFLYRDMA